ncbi:MAG: hypothetical protein ABR577_16980 [Pyrinomonadaceae bacterium]
MLRRYILCLTMFLLFVANGLTQSRSELSVKRSAIVTYVSSYGGTGGGDIHLKLNDQIKIFQYDNRMRWNNFAAGDPYKPGAVWRIVYSVERNPSTEGGPTILLLWSAAFTGHIMPEDTLEGIVVGMEDAPRWRGIVVESGGRRYLVVINNNPDDHVPDPKISGDVVSRGARVRIMYIGTERWSGNMLSLHATRVTGLNNQTATPRRSQNPTVNGDFATFYTAFRSAVRRRDRAALRGMMSNPIEYSLANPSNITPDRMFGFLDYKGGQGWLALERTLAKGTQPYKLPNSRRPARVAKNSSSGVDEWVIFELSSDGQWKWVSYVFPGD